MVRYWAVNIGTQLIDILGILCQHSSLEYILPKCFPVQFSISWYFFVHSRLSLSLSLYIYIYILVNVASVWLIWLVCLFSRHDLESNSAISYLRESNLAFQTDIACAFFIQPIFLATKQVIVYWLRQHGNSLCNFTSGTDNHYAKLGLNSLTADQDGQYFADNMFVRIFLT